MCSKGKMDESLCVHSSRIRYLRLVAFLQELKKKKALQMKGLNKVIETQNYYVGISSLQLSLVDDMCCCWSYLSCFRIGKSRADFIKTSCYCG